jgi:hypothetical protein
MVVSGRRIQGCPRSKGIHVVSPTCNLAILDRHDRDKPVLVRCVRGQDCPVHLILQGPGPAIRRAMHVGCICLPWFRSRTPSPASQRRLWPPQKCWLGARPDQRYFLLSMVLCSLPSALPALKAYSERAPLHNALTTTDRSSIESFSFAANLPVFQWLTVALQRLVDRNPCDP